MMAGLRRILRHVSSTTPPAKVVLARRADGLGERLNSLLNAMRLAKILGVEFRFTWPLGLTARDPDHAIVAAEHFFSADFVAAHLLGHQYTATGYELPTGPKDDLASLRAQLAAAEHGLRAPGLPLSQRIDAAAVPDITRGFAEEFAAVGFHPQIADAISEARAVPLGENAVGIHLRAGDNLFGRYRSWTQYWYKVVPAPIARHLVEQFRAEGRDVLLFGQDRELIADLCAASGAIDTIHLRPAGGRAAAAPAEAMFDLVLLSRCEPIISGWSGFAIQAASIADTSVQNHLAMIEPTEAISIIRADLARHGPGYDPIHRAFAWWAAYYAARHEILLEEALELVSNALSADPTNPRYRLRLAALHYRLGRHDDGDAVLVEALAADAASGEPTLPSVMLFSLRHVAGLDSEEILADFEWAARMRPGPALIYRAALRAQLGDASGARQDVADFGTAISGSPLAAVLDDAVVKATVEKRIR